MRLPTEVSTIRAAVFLASAGAAVLAGNQGCSAPEESSKSPPSVATTTAPGASTGANTGTVGMTLTLPGGETMNTINWVVTGPNGAAAVVQTGSVNVQNSLSVSFEISGIPAGTGYGILLSGTSLDGTVTCSGSVPFSVVARLTTTVSDLLQCDPSAPDAGSVFVMGVPYYCAVVNSLSALPAETTVGHSVALSVTATGANPSGVTYAWLAASGSFDTPASASANFTCSAAGPVTVTVVVGDGAVPDGGACNPSFSTATLHVQCDSD